ncbi:MAG TPA: hypothetical protein VGG41_05355 [Solirubrobacteraceae bacterium]|jgi:hypothetical protein
MCDYLTDPLWTADRQCSLSLEAFPISASTKTALRAWAGRYDTLLGRDFEWPAEEQSAHQQEGRRLWHVLADELGPEYEVGYYDSVLGDDGPTWDLGRF